MYRAASKNWHIFCQCPAFFAVIFFFKSTYFVVLKHDATRLLQSVDLNHICTTDTDGRLSYCKMSKLFWLSGFFVVLNVTRCKGVYNNIGNHVCAFLTWRTRNGSSNISPSTVHSSVKSYFMASFQT